MKEESKTIITLSILSVLTIVCAFFSLNRLADVVFEFKLRLFFEHFLTGFYFPLFVIFVTYWGFCISHRNIKLFGQEHKVTFLRTLVISSLINILFEIWWQFFVSFNSQSIPQTIYLIFGVLICWIYFLKLKLV